MNVNKIMAELERKHPGESEYLQAVREVLMTCLLYTSDAADD